MRHDETSTGFAPSVDSPAQKRRKILAGRGALMLIAGVALAAFSLYILIVLYGIFASQ